MIDCFDHMRNGGGYGQLFAMTIHHPVFNTRMIIILLMSLYYISITSDPSLARRSKPRKRKRDQSNSSSVMKKKEDLFLFLMTSVASAEQNTHPKLEYLIQDPTRWGSHFWYVLHTIAANFRLENTRLRLRREKTVSHTTTSVVDVAPLSGIVKEYLSESELAQAYFSFFDSLQYVLPCPSCRLHYSEFLVEHPIDEFLQVSQSDSDKWLDVWLLQLHNTVNRHHNVPEWTIDQVRQVYDPTLLFDPDNPDIIIKSNNSAIVQDPTTATQAMNIPIQFVDVAQPLPAQQSTPASTQSLTQAPAPQQLLSSQLQNAQRQISNPKIVLDNMTIKPMGFSSFNSSQNNRAALGMTTTGTPGSLLFANNRPRYAEPSSGAHRPRVLSNAHSQTITGRNNSVWPTVSNSNFTTVPLPATTKFGTIAQQFQKQIQKQGEISKNSSKVTVKCTGSSCKATKGKRKCGCRR